MRAIHRILVTIKELDGKVLPAVLKGAQLAGAYGAELELFHALTSPLYSDPVLVRTQGLDSLEQDLRQKEVPAASRQSPTGCECTASRSKCRRNGTIPPMRRSFAARKLSTPT